MLVVDQRPSLTARRNVSACCPNNGQRVSVGRGSARLFQPSNFFFIKRDTVFLFVSLHSATTIFVLKRGLLSIIFPSFAAAAAAAVVVFFCQSSVLCQNRVAFCRRRRPDGARPSACIFTALSRVSARAAAHINEAHSPFMLMVSIT